MVGLRTWEGVRAGSRESFQEESPPPQPTDPRQGPAPEEGRSVRTRTGCQEATQIRGKTGMCESARVCKGQDGPSKHGERLSAIPLPALSMTRAPAAHDHFRMQGQRRADGESGRGARVSSQLSTQVGESCPPRPRTPGTSLTS